MTYKKEKYYDRYVLDESMHFKASELSKHDVEDEGNAPWQVYLIIACTVALLTWFGGTAILNSLAPAPIPVQPQVIIEYIENVESITVGGGDSAEAVNYPAPDIGGLILGVSLLAGLFTAMLCKVALKFSNEASGFFGLVVWFALSMMLFAPFGGIPGAH